MPAATNYWYRDEDGNLFPYDPESGAAVNGGAFYKGNPDDGFTQVDRREVLDPAAYWRETIGYDPRPNSEDFRYSGGGSGVEIKKNGKWEQGVIANGEAMPISTAIAQGIPYQPLPGYQGGSGGFFSNLASGIGEMASSGALAPILAFAGGPLLDAAGGLFGGSGLATGASGAGGALAAEDALLGQSMLENLGSAAAAPATLDWGAMQAADDAGLGSWMTQNGAGVPSGGVLIPSAPSVGGSGVSGATSGTPIPPAPVSSATGAATSATGAAWAMGRIMNGTATAADYLTVGAPLAGGLLGAASGGSSPAGTTTTVQDVPDWQKPYVQNLMSEAQNTYNANKGNQTGINLANSGASNLQSTINGDFLSPDSNPWLKDTYNKAARELTDNYNYSVMPQLSRSFGNQQAFGGSSAFNELFDRSNRQLATGLGDLATGIYGQNYQAERGRQFSGATAAPDYANSMASTPYANLNNYGNIVGRQFGSQTSQPYFQNQFGSALSGALGGAALSKLFGG